MSLWCSHCRQYGHDEASCRFLRCLAMMNHSSSVAAVQHHNNRARVGPDETTNHAKRRMVLNEFSSAITAKEGKAPRSYDEAVGKAKRLAALNSFSLALANKEEKNHPKEEPLASGGEGRVSTILNTPAGQRNVVASSKKAKKRRKGRRRRRSKKRVE